MHGKGMGEAKENWGTAIKKRGKHTIESSLMPFALPHALITHASLYAITAMMSTPLFLRSPMCSM
jgi:hypothetical protein